MTTTPQTDWNNGHFAKFHDLAAKRSIKSRENIQFSVYKGSSTEIVYSL